MAKEKIIPAYTRVNHFHGQFLDAVDFNEAHVYHYTMRRRLNYGLYQYGVIDGLDFDKTTTGSTIRILPGMALDCDEETHQSREIILREPYITDLVNTLGYKSGDGTNAGDTVYITITYAEQADAEEDVAGFNGYSRIIEQAVITIWLDTGTGRQGIPKKDIILGKVTIDKDNKLIYDRTERELGWIKSAPPAAPIISLSQTNMIFAIKAGMTTSQEIWIKNTSAGQFTWGVKLEGPDASRFTISPVIGSTPASFIVAVKTPDQLAEGMYAAALRITSENASNSPQVVTLSAAVTQAPFLVLSHTSMKFTIEKGASAPISQKFSITNAGSGTLRWTAIVTNSQVDNFVLSATNGVTPAEITISVQNPESLNVGTYQAVIQIESADATNSPQTIAITAEITAKPMLAITPSNIIFKMNQGASTPVSQTISIANAVSGILNWTAVLEGTAVNPFELSVTSGTTPASATISVKNPGGLNAGTYQSVLRIESMEAGNSPQSILVSLNVVAVPVLEVKPHEIDFTAFVGEGNPQPQVLYIRNTGGGTLSWIATTEVPNPALCDWRIALSSERGGTPSSITVSIESHLVSVAEYTGRIIITSPEAANSPQTVNIALAVRERVVPQPLQPIQIRQPQLQPIQIRQPQLQPIQIRQPQLQPMEPTQIQPQLQPIQIRQPQLQPMLQQHQPGMLIGPVIPRGIERFPLTAVKGVGSKYEASLKHIGIATIADLANAMSAAIAKELKISERQANTIIEQAKKFLEENPS